MDTTPEITRLISFCTGIRGIERGLERVFSDLRTICAVEIESIAIENLVAEMEAGMVAPHPVWSDIKTFPAHLFRGMVDIITGGFPCTPFSLAGKRKGADDPRHLWPFICRHVKAIEPPICFFENVDDLLTLGFDIVYQDLHEMGYAVEAGIFSAAEVGAPHERQRVFILAVHHSYWDRLRQKYKVPTGRNRVKHAGEVHLHNSPSNGFKMVRFEWENEGSTGLRSGENMEHSDRERLGEEGQCPDRPYQPGEFSEMEDTSHIGSGGRRNEGIEGGRKVQTQRSGELADPYFCRQQQWLPAGVGRVGQSPALRNATGPRSQKRGNVRSYYEQEFQASERTSCQFPAGPGEPQHPWEEPRTITREAEPEMGLTVDGFRFREDILRGLGNAVVPAQSHKAFMTLWNKLFS